jgi:hypothetical protein
MKYHKYTNPSVRVIAVSALQVASFAYASTLKVRGSTSETSVNVHSITFQKIICREYLKSNEISIDFAKI